MRLTASTWLALAATNCALGVTAFAVIAVTESPRPPVVSVTTTEPPATTTTTATATTPATTAAPSTSSGTFETVATTTTLFGSPFTLPPRATTTLTVPPSSAPTTTEPATVAPTTTTVLQGPAPVSLGIAADFSVLAASTVTNTGPTSIAATVGLWPGTSITGFPPGIASVDSSAAILAQLALSTAYLDAAQLIPTEVASALGGQVLTPGVYSGPARSPLAITGNLVLDGPGVYVFQTDSTLITASGSNVLLVNGAQPCNVFWRVGSSATLGTGSSFVGTIMALASITVTTGVTVQGRALAQTGAVTLDSNTFAAC